MTRWDYYFIAQKASVVQRGLSIYSYQMARVKVPKKYQEHWAKPWRRKAKYSPGFRRFLAANKRLSPHYTYAEAACKNGTPVPRYLRYRARNHAFNLERLRHDLGGKKLPVLSWYRPRAYNRQVGGVPNSQHIKAVATDFSKQTVDKFGREKFFAKAQNVFRKGGVGDYPSGSAHCDSRGWRSRWFNS